jgi:hypothetical protein
VRLTLTYRHPHTREHVQIDEIVRVPQPQDFTLQGGATGHGPVLGFLPNRRLLGARMASKESWGSLSPQARAAGPVRPGGALRPCGAGAPQHRVGVLRLHSRGVVVDDLPLSLGCTAEQPQRGARGLVVEVEAPHKASDGDDTGPTRRLEPRIRCCEAQDRLSGAPELRDDPAAVRTFPVSDDLGPGPLRDESGVDP